MVPGLLGRPLRRNWSTLDPPAAGTPPRVPIRQGWVTPPCIWTILSGLPRREISVAFPGLGVEIGKQGTWRAGDGALLETGADG